MYLQSNIFSAISLKEVHFLRRLSVHADGASCCLFIRKMQLIKVKSIKNFQENGLLNPVRNLIKVLNILCDQSSQQSLENPHGRAESNQIS